MSSDIFTKNVGGADFKKHIKAFVGEDKYTKRDDSVDDEADTFVPSGKGCYSALPGTKEHSKD
jgi:hypothetical protein